MITYQVKGNLFSGDLLEDLAIRQGQSANDFDLSAGIRVSDEASRVFSMARTQWTNFQQTTERMHPEQSQVTPTRQLWILPLLSFLGYELQFQKAREAVGEHSFYISHRTLNKDQFPVHIIDCRESLDENPDSPRHSPSRGNRDSAHVQMQEYLNHTEHLYGIITNGYKLRLLRDHHRLTGLQYLEWDLEAMMTDKDLASFTMLYRMLHVSRIPRKMGDDSLLELYHQHSVEEGHRVRDKLKAAVFQSLKLLGNGFLKHPANDDLREAIASKSVSHIAYGQCLRALVYRLLFLFVAEDRKLVFQPEADPEAKKLYLNYYSLQRLRLLAEAHLSANPRHSDVWEQLKTTFRLYEEAGIGEPLGIAPLGGDLFKPDAMECLRGASIDNRTLLKALDLLSRFDQEKGQRTRINYRRINVEEFGAVYESLLELNPEIDLQVQERPFQYIDGESRKGTGSYYTHEDLVRQLLKTALEPVVRKRLAEAERGITDPDERRTHKEAALLRISVCDPACGSGAFLVAAARALATELAYLRAPRGASIDAYEQAAKRDVIEHCIYGVDVNPDAVELCRLVLWMESHEAGKPITYLDHKIRCGNSLVGWLGSHRDPVIPNAAFVALTEDDKELVKSCLHTNKTAVANRSQQEVGFDESEMTRSISQEWHTRIAAQPVVALEDYWRKKQAHQQWQDRPEQARKRMAYNLWTYAFFQSYASADAPIVTQRTLNQWGGNNEKLAPELVNAVKTEAKAARFFHWPLEFPEVFEKGGFDILLGNPPWARIKLQEKKFFAGRKPEIVNAANAAERKKLITALDSEDDHFLAFQSAKRHANGLGRYLRHSGQYTLTNAGDINTYSVFSERVLRLVAPHGRSGTIVPTGIATDHTNRHFFAHVVQQKRLVSLFDFENRDGLFPAVDSRFKCCLITLVGTSAGAELQPQFGFYLHQVSDLNDLQRVFELSAEDFVRINPNTKTCPVLRTQADAAIVKGLYGKFPVMESVEGSPWKARFITQFHMSNDSEDFQYRIDFYGVEKERLRLYEAKMFWHFNHRFNSFKSTSDRNGGVQKLGVDELADPRALARSFYCLDAHVVQARKELMEMGTGTRWFLGFRNIARSTDARTFIDTILPDAAFGNSCILIQSEAGSGKQCVLVAMLSSLVFDFVCRQKLGGTSLSFFIIKQLPVIPPEDFTEQDIQFLVPRVLELTYTAWDLKYFADDVWKDADPPLRELIVKRWDYNRKLISIPDYLEASFQRPDWVDEQTGEFPHTPFRWDSDHRHRVQCELDAFFAYKYHLDTEELKYILDPTLSKLAGNTPEERAAFPGETFRVLKEKEIKQYKEYRTARLVLESWQSKPWECPHELPDVRTETQLDSRRRNYAKIRRMPPVIARIMHRHENPRYARLLGRTKLEKMLHIIEAETELDFGRVPEKHRFGPADLVALDEAVNQGKTQNAFKQVQKNPKKPEAGYTYQKLESFESMLARFEAEFQIHQPQIDRIIDLLVPLDRTETELIATVHATWSNLLIKNASRVTDERIISESHAWGEEKKARFQRDDFVQPLQWLRKHGLVPKGEGKEVCWVNE